MAGRVVLTVRLFASLREALGAGEVRLDWSDECASVAGLLTRLGRERGEAWQQQLAAPTVLLAVNQIMAERDVALRDGDEIAFFPPVSGG